MNRPHPIPTTAMQVSHYSFDVFDTVLTRVWAKPTDLFWELGHQLRQQQFIDLSPDEWLKLRVHAEGTARTQNPTNEILLQDIYEQLGKVLHWSEEIAAQAMEFEIQLERSSLCPIPANQRKIQALHEQNRSVTFLSDMYLPSEIIQGFLQDHQLWTNQHKLYVSGEVGLNKVSGKLFQHYLAQHTLQPFQLHHTGDNLHSDIKSAKKIGINAQPFLQAHLNRYEQLIADDEQLPLRFRSLLAGASRLTRLRSPEADLHRQTIWNTAANVIAPVFFGFVHWVLQEAQKQGIQRLYFMARDGQILYKIAQIICRKWGYTIDCRYFYGSRQSLHFPSIQAIGAVEQTWIFDNPEFLSVRVVCERVNLRPEQIADSLTQHGFLPERWDENLTDPELTALQAAFQEPAIHELIVELAASYREKALGYFKQEGMGDGVPFATVDTGWTGKTQRSLSRILAAGNMYPPTGLQGYFFGLTTSHLAFPTDRLNSYFMEPTCTTERRLLCDSQIIELFLTADHGTTLRYEQQGDRYFPVLKAEKNEKAIQWGVLVQHEAILTFAELLTDNLQPDDCKPEYFERVTEAMLTTFIHTPNKEEAEAFGTQSFSQHQSESKFYDLAPAYTLADGFRMLTDWQYIHGFAWLAASIQRSAPLTRLLLRYVKGLRQSYVYATLGWNSFADGNNSQSWKMVKKAIKVFPPILLSRKFMLLNLSLAARSALKPKDYGRLRQLFHVVLRGST